MHRAACDRIASVDDRWFRFQVLYPLSFIHYQLFSPSIFLRLQIYTFFIELASRAHKKSLHPIGCRLLFSSNLLRNGLLHLLHDSLESLGIVHGEVSQHLAVDFYTGLREGTHQA